jgi:hypothetical protein
MPASFEGYPVVGSWALSLQWLGPAKTPQEALDKFSMLVKKRDYKHALLYCSGPWADEVRGATEPATALAVAIDNLNHALDTFKVKADKVRVVLALLEPLPAEVKVEKLEHKAGENQAKATLTLVVSGKDVSPSEVAVIQREWKCDPLMLLTLVPALDWKGGVDLKEESGEGWKIQLPALDRLKKTVPRLKERSANYVRFLEQIKADVKTGKVVADIESELKKRLDEEAK